MTDWPLVRLGDLCRFVNGKAFKPTDWSSAGIPIIRIQNLRDPSKLFNFWAGDLRRQVIVKQDDLLLAWSGTPGTSFGAHVWNGPTSVLNQHIFRVDILDSRLTRDWALHAVNRKLDVLIHRAHGGVGLQHFTKSVIQGLEIPLPPADKQRRIVDILNHAASIRRLREQAKAKAKEFVPTLFLDMFGDPATKRWWPMMPLKDLCSKITDGTHQSPRFTNQGIPFIFISNIADGKISLTTSQYISEATFAVLTRQTPIDLGDTLYSTVGSYGIAAPVDVPERFCFQRHIAILKPNRDKVRPLFLTCLMNSPFIRRQADGAARGLAQKTVNLGDIKKFSAILPPLELQEQFIQKIIDLRATIDLMDRAGAAAEQLQAALMARLFTGG